MSRQVVLDSISNRNSTRSSTRSRTGSGGSRLTLYGIGRCTLIYPFITTVITIQFTHVMKYDTGSNYSSNVLQFDTTFTLWIFNPASTVAGKCCGRGKGKGRGTSASRSLLSFGTGEDTAAGSLSG